jgi:hypothetical protein
MILLYLSAAFAAECDLIRDETDKFTGETVVETDWLRLHGKLVVSKKPRTSIDFVDVQATRKGETVMLGFKVRQANGVFPLARSSVVLLRGDGASLEADTPELLPNFRGVHNGSMDTWIHYPVDPAWVGDQEITDVRFVLQLNSFDLVVHEKSRAAIARSLECVGRLERLQHAALPATSQLL